MKPCQGECGRAGKRFAGGYWCCVDCYRGWRCHTFWCNKRQP